VKVGTIGRKMNKYCLEPIIPGIFEKYYQKRLDTEENHIKAAKYFRDLIKNVLPQHAYEMKWKIFRPVLPLEAEEKLIEINEEYDVESQALPYELVKNLIDKNENFAVIPYQCRLIGEMNGEPCEVASAEDGCFIVGIGAQLALDQTEGARRLTKEEAIEFIKMTEKAGLVHNSTWDKGNDSSMYICNCCSCHCGSLYASKIYQFRAVHPSNFAPKFNMNICVKCETCVKKCPVGAIYHRWPIESDASDERMVLRENLCIGCGICAVNCPENAIKMIKVRDIEAPEKNYIGGNKTFIDLLME